MVRKSSPTPDIDEIIALLKKSRLPTVIVEGKDDLIIYSKLESRFYEKDLSVFPVGGRNNVLKIFERLGELPEDAKIFFIADKDNWIITGIPLEYHSEQLFFTNGYSIENDVFQDGNIPSYMSKEEDQRFRLELRRFLSWYALALDRNITNGDEEIKLHANHILDDIREYDRLTELREGESFPEQRYKELSENYQNLLRGKSLMQLAMRQLSYNGRAARHTDKGFLEHVAVRPGPLIEKIMTNIEVALE